MNAALAQLALNAFCHSQTAASLGVSALMARFRIETNDVMDLWEAEILAKPDTLAAVELYPQAALDACLAPYLAQAKQLVADGNEQAGFLIGSEATQIVRERFQAFAMRQRDARRAEMAAAEIPFESKGETSC